MELHRCEKSSDGQVDVIFVHGLTGHQRDTWTNQTVGFWPEALAERLGTAARVWSFSYDAPLLTISEGGRLRETLGTDAATALEVLKQRQIGDRPIVFVTHSLGGLMVKAMLRRADEARSGPLAHLEHRIAATTRAVVFFATPHCGSSLVRLKLLIPMIAKVGATGLATGLALLAAVPQLILTGLPLLLRWVLRPSQYVEHLGDNNPYLRELGDSYRRFAERHGIETVAYYEQKPVLGVHVVSPCSADPGLPQCTPVGLPENHIGIAKLSGNASTAVPFAHLEGLVNKVASRAGAGTVRAVFEDSLENEISALFHDPKLAPLKTDFERPTGGRPHIVLPKRFTSIPAAQNLRSEFERLLRVRLRTLIDGGGLALSDADVAIAEQSVYDLDKYVLYLWREHNLQAEFKAMRISVEHEAKRIKHGVVSDGEPSLISLYRAARALEHTIADETSNILQSTREAQSVIIQQKQQFPLLDDGYETRDLLERLERALTQFQNTAELARREQTDKRQDRLSQRGEDVYRTVTGTIASPVEEEVIGTSYMCSGTVTGLSADLQLRLVVEIENRAWPKEDNVQVDRAQGKWSAKLFELGTEQVTFSLSLYVITADVKEDIFRWLKRSAETGSYPGLPGIQGGRRLDIVNLRRRPHNVGME